MLMVGYTLIIGYFIFREGKEYISPSGGGGVSTIESGNNFFPFYIEMPRYSTRSLYWPEVWGHLVRLTASFTFDKSSIIADKPPVSLSSPQIAPGVTISLSQAMTSCDGLSLPTIPLMACCVTSGITTSVT